MRQKYVYIHAYICAVYILYVYIYLYKYVYLRLFIVQWSSLLIAMGWGSLNVCCLWMERGQLLFAVTALTLVVAACNYESETWKYNIHFVFVLLKWQTFFSQLHVLPDLLISLIVIWVSGSNALEMHFSKNCVAHTFLHYTFFLLSYALYFVFPM